MKYFLLLALFVSSIHLAGAKESRLLHQAAIENNLETAQFLIEKGADVNAKDKHKSTPLDYAIEFSDMELVQFLLDNGAQLDLKDNNILFYVARNKDIRVFQFVKNKGFNDFNINNRFTNESTLLHRAALGDSISVAQILIEKGADVNAKDESKNTPLHNAAYGNSSAVAQILIEKGADIHAEGQYEKTPLHFAAEQNSTEAAQLLIDKGADVNAKDELEETPLHKAAYENSTEAAQLLIDKGADINAEDYSGIFFMSGITPLDAAIRYGHHEMIELLKKHGAK